MFRSLILLLLVTPSIAVAQGERGYPQPVRDKRQITERTTRFNREIKSHGFTGSVPSCNVMMQVAVGVRGGNISYGAICNIVSSGKAQRVMVCDDDLVGHFALKASTFAESEDAVVEFVRNNCYGG